MDYSFGSQQNSAGRASSQAGMYTRSPHHSAHSSTPRPPHAQGSPASQHFGDADPQQQYAAQYQQQQFSPQQSTNSGNYHHGGPQQSSHYDHSATMGAPTDVPNVYANQSRTTEATLQSILANYQPNFMVGDVQISAPDASSLGLAPVMVPSDQNMQLDPATATAAAAAYGKIAPRPTMYSDSSFASQYTPGLPQQQALDPRPSLSQHAQRSVSALAGYDGDGSNSASTQTPGPSSSGEESEPLRAHDSSLYGALQVARGPVRASSSMSSSSASVFGARKDIGQRPQADSAGTAQLPTQSRSRRTQSGTTFVDLGEQKQRASLDAPLGAAITVGGTASIQQLRQDGQNAHATVNETSGKPATSGYAASHPPGLGSQVLRGVDGHTSGSNAASDFTRRKGWHTRIVDEFQDFVHVLDPDGKVVYTASSVYAMTGWKPEELVGHNIDEFIHVDDSMEFLQELKSCFEDKSEMTMYYRFRKKPLTAIDKQRVRDQRAATDAARSGSTSEGDSSNQEAAGANIAPRFTDASSRTREDERDNDETELTDDFEDKYVILEVYGHPYTWADGDDLERKHGDGEGTREAGESTKRNSTGAIEGAASNAANSADDKTKGNFQDKEEGAQKKIECFFCSGRVYPTKNVGMLDSFLELKLENERLRMLVGELSLTEGDATNPTDASSEGRRSLDEVGYHPDYSHIDNLRAGPHQSDLAAGVSFGGMGRGAEAANSPARRRSSVQSATGRPSSPMSPRARHFERRMTGGTIGAASQDLEEDSDEEADSPALGFDDEDASKRKKKKPKPEEGDYVCTDCGRVDSPEWRKGPLGPKTLCNACGLRWAKKIKRSGGDPNAAVGKGYPPTGLRKQQAPQYQQIGDVGGAHSYEIPQAYTTASVESMGQGHTSQISGAPGFAAMVAPSQQELPSMYGDMTGGMYDGGTPSGIAPAMYGPSPRPPGNESGRRPPSTYQSSSYLGQASNMGAMQTPASQQQNTNVGQNHMMGTMYGSRGP